MQIQIHALPGGEPAPHPTQTIVVADEADAFPCRRCMTDAQPGERLLLLPYDPFRAESPYTGHGPIFVHADGCEPFRQNGEVPEQLRRRLLAIRAYDSNAMMIGVGRRRRDIHGGSRTAPAGRPRSRLRPRALRTRGLLRVPGGARLTGARPRACVQARGPSRAVGQPGGGAMIALKDGAHSAYAFRTASVRNFPVGLNWLSTVTDLFTVVTPPLIEKQTRCRSGLTSGNVFGFGPGTTLTAGLHRLITLLTLICGIGVGENWSWAQTLAGSPGTVWPVGSVSARCST